VSGASSPTHAEPPDEDLLLRLALEAGARPSRVERLTTLRSRRLRRASFRLTCADGRTLKGRILESAEQARRVADLLPLLEPRHFPALIACHGPALLLEWVEGVAPGPGAMEPALIDRCGALLGAVHAIVAPRCLVALHGFPAAAWQDRLEANLDRLETMGALAPSETRELLARARDFRPQDPPVGLVHGDFCPENIVLAGHDRVAVVDNETLTIDVLSYDLARTGHRWTMAPDEWETFLRGYRRCGDPAGYLEHRPFWDIAVLGEAAVFRLAGETGGADAILRRLKGLTERGI